MFFESRCGVGLPSRRCRSDSFKAVGAGVCDFMTWVEGRTADRAIDETAFTATTRDVIREAAALGAFVAVGA